MSLPAPLARASRRAALGGGLGATALGRGWLGLRGAGVDPPEQRPRHRLGIGIEHDLASTPAAGAGTS